ncbi:MAG: response regulator transcription factor [Nitrososphaeraceae archaeon]|jgi:DNA-binding response OmpR family regulator
MKEDSTYQFRILVVDDEPDILLALKIVLESNGFRTEAFGDPILALRSFIAGSYDLALLDIRMPRITGLGLYKELRKIDNKIRVCFLSAISNYQEFAKYFPTINENQIIVKPVDNQTLIQRINKIMSL